MKKIASMLVALAMAAGASVAQAADNAWFTLQGGGPDVTVISQGPGQALVIEKQPGPGTTTLTIGYNVSSAGGPLGGYAYALNAQSQGQTALFSNPQNVGAGFSAPFPGPTGETLVYGAGSPAGTGAPGLVSTFTLVINKLGPLGETNIFGDFGPTAQAYASGYAWYGRVGPNPVTYGLPNYADDVGPGWGPLPVITIRNIPEPASIALLGVGALALIRRRK